MSFFSQPIKAVLFDIDDTLVDWGSASDLAVQSASKNFLPQLTEDDWRRILATYRLDVTGRYQAYLTGELGFVEQRILRIQLAFAEANLELTAEHAEPWNLAYETEIDRSWAPFADVETMLDALDAARIPYGAVSNNVADYQRRKLDVAGLERVAALVGTDTVGVPKPDPAIFHEGARLLGADPAHTLYVGDNLVIDALGAAAAGMPSVWLNRAGGVDERWSGPQIASLDELVGLLAP